jgi:hypothetical protein
MVCWLAGSALRCAVLSTVHLCMQGGVLLSDEITESIADHNENNINDSGEYLAIRGKLTRVYVQYMYTYCTCYFLVEDSKEESLTASLTDKPDKTASGQIAGAPSHLLVVTG